MHNAACGGFMKCIENELLLCVKGLKPKKDIIKRAMMVLSEPQEGAGCVFDELLHFRIE